MSEAAARSSRDFFHGLIQDSQAPRAGFLLERERWLRSVQVEGREELLFEFEMLLRGVERYFNLHNLPLEQGEPVVTRDFLPELLDVRDAIDEAIRIARRLLDPDSDQKMVFRKYVESCLADDRARRVLLEEELDQDTPQEALFVLRQSFEALRTVIDHLGQLSGCPFALFNEIGNLALREIVLNVYFRPFRPLEFRLEYDRIKSVPVLEALAGLPEAERRLFTVAFLGLFRVLHYLSYVRDDEGAAPPRRARVILALTRSEVSTLVKHLLRELAPRVEVRAHRAGAIAAARALEQGHARIVAELLRGDDPRGPVDAAVAFTSLLREQLVVLARALDPKLDEANLFDRLVSKRAMAERLCTDLGTFSALTRAAAARMRQGPESFDRAVRALQQFVGEFHQVGYQLLRYGDFEPVDRFTGLVLELEPAKTGPAARDRFAEDCDRFAPVVEAIFAAVSRRQELRGSPFDDASARAAVARLLPAELSAS